MLDSLSISVPCIPPSVNHYVKHSRGRHFKSTGALIFESLIRASANGRNVFSRSSKYEIHIIITLGKKEKGDIDNFPKLVLDSLVRADVIPSDNMVTKLVVEKVAKKKDRPDNGSTWVKVSALEEN